MIIIMQYFKTKTYYLQFLVYLLLFLNLAIFGLYHTQEPIFFLAPLLLGILSLLFAIVAMNHNIKKPLIIDSLGVHNFFNSELEEDEEAENRFLNDKENDNYFPLIKWGEIKIIELEIHKFFIFDILFLKITLKNSKEIRHELAENPLNLLNLFNKELSDKLLELKINHNLNLRNHELMKYLVKSFFFDLILFAILTGPILAIEYKLGTDFIQYNNFFFSIHYLALLFFIFIKLVHLAFAILFISYKKRSTSLNEIYIHGPGEI